MLGIKKAESRKRQGRIRALVGALAIVGMMVLLTSQSAQAATSTKFYQYSQIRCDSYFQGIDWKGGKPSPGGYATRYRQGDFCIYSPSRAYHVIFQDDGNLVEYKGSKAVWNSRTNGKGFSFQTQPDGNVVIYDKNNQSIWSTATYKQAGEGRELLLIDSGKFSVNWIHNGYNQGAIWTA